MLMYATKNWSSEGLSYVSSSPINNPIVLINSMARSMAHEVAQACTFVVVSGTSPGLVISYCWVRPSGLCLDTAQDTAATFQR